MITIMVDSNKAENMLNFLGLAYKDYIAARTLLRTQQLFRGIILCCTAIEKYFKVFLAAEGSTKKTHDVLKLLDSVRAFDSDLAKSINSEFIALLSKSYSDKQLVISEVIKASRIANNCGVNLILFYSIYCIPIILLLDLTYESCLILFGHCLIITAILVFSIRFGDLMMKPATFLGKLYQEFLSTREPDEKQINLAIYGANVLINEVTSK